MRACYRVLGAVTVAMAILGLAGTAFMGDPYGKYESEGRRSGYTYAEPETQGMQDDEIENPVV